jgi:Uma2 family endonuclease
MLRNKIALGNILARDVSFEDYLRLYAEHHAEWVEGTVIKLSPVSRKHDLTDGFLHHLLRIYLSRVRCAKLLHHPFVMKITPKSPAREPDLHIVLNERAHIIQDTMTAGPTDVVVEVVSPESIDRDTQEKFAEYEAGGVREYWLFDPQMQTANFYALDANGIYQVIAPTDGIFRSTVLPRFSLPVDVLWQPDILENDDQIRVLVDAMLKDA